MIKATFALFTLALLIGSANASADAMSNGAMQPMEKGAAMEGSMNKGYAMDKDTLSKDAMSHGTMAQGAMQSTPSKESMKSSTMNMKKSTGQKQTQGAKMEENAMMSAH